MRRSSGEHRETMMSTTELQEENTVLQKERSCGQARGLLEKGLMDGWNRNRTYWFKWEAIMSSLYSSVSYPICETWCWWCHGLGLFYCIVARTACHHWWTMTSELYQKILQEHICLRTESHENVGHEDPAMKVNVKVQTIIQLKCCGRT